MKNLFEKNRGRRNKETLLKSFLLLVSIVSALGMRICLINEDPLSSLNGNEEALSSSSPVLANELEIQAQEVKKKKLDLNKASEEDLMKLPGIGEKTAKKILEYRKKMALTLLLSRS